MGVAILESREEILEAVEKAETCWVYFKPYMGHPVSVEISKSEARRLAKKDITFESANLTRAGDLYLA